MSRWWARLQPPPLVRSAVAGALGVGGALFLARWLGRYHAPKDWFFFDLATIWLWQLYLSAACVIAGHALVERLAPGRERGWLESLALAYPTGLVTFGLCMYVGGFLSLFRPGFAVVLPALMIAAGFRRALATVSRARALGTVPALHLSGLPLVASLFGVLGLAVIYLGAMSPDAVNYDASWMHLVIAQDYAREGRVVPFPGDWVLNVPHFASVIQTWAFLVPGLGQPALRWMMALHTEFVVVVWTMVGIAATCRWLAEREVRGSWSAFLLFPGIFVYDSNLGGAADHFMALYAAPLLLATDRASRRFDRGACVLWGGLAGGALATKLQASYLIAPLGLWVLVRAVLQVVRHRQGASEGTPARTVVYGLAAMGGVSLLVFAPHLVRNLAFFKNPLYPFLQDVFTASTPAVKDAAQQVGTLMADWHWRAPSALGERLSSALEMAFTFSFTPHYSFIGDLPVFGSTFTLALPLLLVVPRSRRLWIGALVSLGALGMWALTYWVDRNLQTFLPLLVAVTAALLVRAWELGWLARAGVAALVVVQLAWGMPLAFSGTDRMQGALGLLRGGLDGHASEQLRGYRSQYVALGKSLPDDAKIMLHNFHLSLGIDRPIILDWIGFEGIIDYRLFRTPRDLYERLRAIGITDVVYVPGSRPAATRQGEIIFDVFADQLGGDRRHFAELALFHLPSSPPPAEAPYQVLVSGLPGYEDGLYPVEALSTCEESPPAMRHYARPIRTGSPAALLDAARVVLASPSAPLELTTGGRLGREFREIPSAGGLRVLIRR